jgi:hypothetical protein
MNTHNEQIMARHACDLCGAERVPGNAACDACGTVSRPWVYLTHEQAFQLLITSLQDAYGREYIITNYDGDRAVIAAFDVLDGGGHIGDL